RSRWCGPAAWRAPLALGDADRADGLSSLQRTECRGDVGERVDVGGQRLGADRAGSEQRDHRGVGVRAGPDAEHVKLVEGDQVDRQFRAGTAGQELPVDLRSEEHTSELQSLTNLVCRLLLEKKNKPTHRSCV